MDRFIPKEKMSKKARRRLESQRRATWSFSPTARRVESKKTYNRKKSHERFDASWDFFFQIVQLIFCPEHVSLLVFEDGNALSSNVFMTGRNRFM